MRWFVLTLAAVLAMTGISFGQVTLDYVTNPDPTAGYKSYAVQATGVGINVLGGFTITGDVYQVWTAPDTQSEWINNTDGNTLGDPMDSYVVFGDERLADLPSTFPENPQGPRVTYETIQQGGMQGLGTLNNGSCHAESTGQDAADPVGVPAIPGDANGDGLVDENDIQIMAQNWYAEYATWEMGDFNGDGMVGPADASILAANWGYAFEESSTAGGERDADEMGGPCAGSGEGGGFDFADAYLSLGIPSETEWTVDLMKLVIPEGDIVTVELELYTAELDPYEEWFTDITQYSFCGDNALSVPEPSTLLLLVLGVLGLGVLRFPRK